MHALQPEQVQRLLEHARLEFRTLFLLAVTTGTRLGELLALLGCAATA